MKQGHRLKGNMLLYDCEGSLDFNSMDSSNSELAICGWNHDAANLLVGSLTEQLPLY